MEFHQVRYFLVAAKHLSFTRAAQEIGISQPSLTRAIQKLEKELYGPLFRRERAHTHLTELGRMVLPHLEATDAAAEAVKAHARRVQAMKSGSVALGVCAGLETSSIRGTTVAIVRQLGGLEFSVEVGPFETLEASLMAGRLDAAVLPMLDDTNERFQQHVVSEDEIVLALPSQHRFEALDRISLQDLDGEPLVLRNGCLCAQALATAMASRGLRLVSRHQSNDSAWVADLVRSGLGCAVFPRNLAEAFGLAFRALRDGPPCLRVALVTVSGRRRSAALSILIDRLVDRRAPTFPALPNSGQAAVADLPLAS